MAAQDLELVLPAGSVGDQAIQVAEADHQVGATQMVDGAIATGTTLAHLVAVVQEALPLDQVVLADQLVAEVTPVAATAVVARGDGIKKSRRLLG